MSEARASPLRVRGEEESREHIFALLVDNEPGVLARVIGLFSSRGYNIESLSVSEVDARRKVSRITIATSGTAMVIAQIKAQLERVVPVHKVSDLTESAEGCIAMDLALVKLVADSAARARALERASSFPARLVDEGEGFSVFVAAGAVGEIDAFLASLQPLGVVEVSRTGFTALARGDALL